LVFAVISGGTLQPANGDGFTIDFITATDRLAGSRAGPAKYAWNHVGTAVQEIRFVETGL
jgi:hypothetical protein